MSLLQSLEEPALSGDLPSRVSGHCKKCCDWAKMRHELGRPIARVRANR
jgi:hypothetical protein